MLILIFAYKLGIDVYTVLQMGTDTPFGQLPIVKHFMKGIFELRPSFPKHKDIWDLHIVFCYRNMHPN